MTPKRNNPRPASADKQITDFQVVKSLSARGYIPELPQGIQDIVVYARQTILTPASDIRGIPAVRVGKELYYHKFWEYVEKSIPDKKDRRYVGLPANQVDYISSQCKSAVACEYKKDRAIQISDFLKSLEIIRGRKLNVTVEQRDIFRYMEDTTDTFNIFDLDLMCHIGSCDRVEKWGEAIAKASSSGEKTVVGLVNSVGRNINRFEHSFRTGYFAGVLQKFFTIRDYDQFSYCDRHVPMYCSIYQLE